MEVLVQQSNQSKALHAHFASLLRGGCQASHRTPMTTRQTTVHAQHIGYLDVGTLPQLVKGDLFISPPECVMEGRLCTAAGGRPGLVGPGGSGCTLSRSRRRNQPEIRAFPRCWHAPAATSAGSRLPSWASLATRLEVLLPPVRKCDPTYNRHRGQVLRALPGPCASACVQAWPVLHLALPPVVGAISGRAAR